MMNILGFLKQPNYTGLFRKTWSKVHFCISLTLAVLFQKSRSRLPSSSLSNFLMYPVLQPQRQLITNLFFSFLKSVVLYSHHSSFQILASRTGFSITSWHVCLLFLKDVALYWPGRNVSIPYKVEVPMFLHNRRGYHIVLLGQKLDVIYLWAPWGQELCLLHL